MKNMNKTDIFLGNRPGCGQKPSMHNIGFVVFFCATILVGLGGNILVCVGVAACRSLRSATNLLVASLALSDIGVCLTIMPFRILEYMQVCPRRFMCIIFMTTDVAFSTASVLTLLVISIDRYLAVSFPFWYQDLVTTKRTILVAAAVWTYSALWATAAPFGWRSQLVSIDVYLGKCVNYNIPYTMTVNAVHFYFPLLVISVIYGRLWHIAKNEEATIEALSLRRSRRVVHKCSVTVAMVYLAFVVCWLPNAILVTIFTIKPQIFHGLMATNEKLAQALNDIFVAILPPLNSMLNPFIYGLYSSQFRATFFRLLSRKSLGTACVRSPSKENNRALQTFEFRATHRATQLRREERNLLNADNNCADDGLCINQL